MKYLYEYRTSDNARHSGEIRAASRDAAFSALKAQGIKPFSVEEAPGFGNWFRAHGWKYLVLVLIVVAGLVGVYYRVVETRENARPAIRHAIPGLDVSLETLKTYFDHPGEVILALYAQPGTPAPMLGWPPQVEQDFLDCIARPVKFRDFDSPKVRELKKIVAGLKEEARRFMADGGTVQSYVMMLTTRQNNEVGFRNETTDEVKLKAMGMKPRSR